MKEINKTLKEQYGKDLLGNPTFKLVSTLTETEIRQGDFPFYAGERLVGIGPDTRKVLKYNYLDAGYVLEANVELLRKMAEKAGKVLAFDVIAEKTGIKNSTYEPIWFFEASKPVELWACLHLINKLLNGKRMSKETAEAMTEAEKKEYVDFVLGYLDEKETFESFQAGLGERVYPATKEFERG